MSCKGGILRCHVVGGIFGVFFSRDYFELSSSGRI